MNRKLNKLKIMLRWMSLKLKLGSQRSSCRGQVGGVGGDRVEGLDGGVGEG